MNWFILNSTVEGGGSKGIYSMANLHKDTQDEDTLVAVGGDYKRIQAGSQGNCFV